MNKKKKIIIIASALGAALCIAVILLVYTLMGSKYRDIFFPNTVINGIDCSGLTAKEAEALLQKAVEEYSLAVHFRGGTTENIEGSEFDYTYVSDGSVQELLGRQNLLFWAGEVKKEHNYTAEHSVTYSQEQLDALITALPELQEASMTPPTDARVEYQTDQYVIIPPEEGNTLNPSEVVAAVNDAVTAGDTSLDLEEKELYVRPAVLADDPKIQEQAEQLNKLANAHIIYNLPDGTTAELTPEMLRSWLTQNADGSYTRDEAVYEENLRAFVADLDSKTTSAGADHLFDTTMDGTISVPYGDLSTYTGYQLDTEGELAALKTQIDENQHITREPVYLTTGGGIGNHGLGNTYVELNLSRQHLWYYKDGALVFDTNIVSGSMTTWRYTPEGWYYLAYKSSPHTMKGEINPATGQPIYTAKCTYWMNFIPSVGIGFHDYDNGRSNWSSTAYLYNGSHGCINMHLSDAKTLYESLEIGTPVVVYYSEPYTLRQELSPAQQYAQSGGGSGNASSGSNSGSSPTPTPEPTTPPATTTPAPTPEPTAPPATATPTPPATATPTPEPVTPPATEVPTETPSDASSVTAT